MNYNQTKGQERFDIGLYLAAAQDQARTGQCTSSIITSDNYKDFINLDASTQVEDQCGDITNTPIGHNPQIVSLKVTTTCKANKDGNLLLPNCTSWRQPGSNGVCKSVSDAYPGARSKCRCDDNFPLPVRVEHPNLGITKSALPTQVDEPGGEVTYSLVITNPAVVTAVALSELTEDDNNDGKVDFIFNDQSTPKLSEICYSTELAPCGPDPKNCADGSTTTCTFTGYVSGNAGASITDKACISGINSGPVGPFCASASVSIKDVKPTAVVVKGAQDAAVCAVVRYSVQVENTDPVEELTLTALCDNMFGDVSAGKNSDPICPSGNEQAKLRTGAQTCNLPWTLAKSDGKSGGLDTYNCTFDAEVCHFPHLNAVTATLNDNDGNTITRTGNLGVTGATVSHNP